MIIHNLYLSLCRPITKLPTFKLCNDWGRSVNCMLLEICKYETEDVFVSMKHRAEGFQDNGYMVKDKLAFRACFFPR